MRVRVECEWILDLPDDVTDPNVTIQELARSLEDAPLHDWPGVFGFLEARPVEPWEAGWWDEENDEEDLTPPS